MDIDKVRELAQNETTTPEILKKLARCGDYRTRKYIAANPSTPIKLLEILGEEFPEKIVNNPIFDLLILENPESYFVRLSLARSSTTKPEILAKLAELKDYSILSAIASNPQTPLTVLEKLSEILSLQVGIAANPKTSLSVLKKLATSKSLSVKQAVARNKNVSEEILKILASDRDLRVLLAITQNINTPTSILEIVAAGEESIVRDSLINHPNFTDSVRDVIKFMDSEGRVSLTTLEKLANHPYLEIRQMVADNIYSSADILDRLVEVDDSKILESITIHPNVTLDILNKLASRLIEYAQENKRIENRSKYSPKKYVLSKCYISLIQNKNIALNIKLQLVDFISTINYTGVLKKIAESKLVEPEILLRVIGGKAIYPNVLELWLNLTKNINTPQSVIEIIFSEFDPNEKSYVDRNRVDKLYKCIYLHQNTPLSIKQAIAKNNRVSKSYIAANSITSQDTLRELSKSSNSFIRRDVINDKNTPIDVFEYYLQNPKLGMIVKMAECKNTPVSILEKLATKKDIYTKTALASNPNSTVSILENLAKEEKYTIRIEVAKNTHTPAHILDFLVEDPHGGVCLNTIKNNNISQSTLIRTIEGDRKYISEVKLDIPIEEMCQHFNISQEEFRRSLKLEHEKYYSTPLIIESPVIQTVLLEKILSEQYNFPQSIAIDAIAKYYSLPVIQKIAQNNNISSFYLDYLAFNIPDRTNIDKENYLSILQRNIAANLNTSISTLEKLAQSPSTEIKNIARKTIKTKLSVSKSLKN